MIGIWLAATVEIEAENNWDNTKVEKSPYFHCGTC